MKYIVARPTEKYKPCLRWAKMLSESEFSEFENFLSESELTEFKNFQNENQNEMLKMNRWLPLF